MIYTVYNIIVTSYNVWAGRKTRVHQSAGLFICNKYKRGTMKELSIFVDESGDFGEYNYQSPYYIISMVFHNQNINIDQDLNK